MMNYKMDEVNDDLRWNKLKTVILQGLFESWMDRGDNAGLVDYLYPYPLSDYVLQCSIATFKCMSPILRCITSSTKIIEQRGSVPWRRPRADQTKEEWAGTADSSQPRDNVIYTTWLSGVLGIITASRLKQFEMCIDYAISRLIAMSHRTKRQSQHADGAILW